MNPINRRELLKLARSQLHGQPDAAAGQAIYLGWGLEAVYAGTRMKPVRDYLASLGLGLIPHLAASADTLILHLLADTGNKGKKLRSREEFLPVEKVHPVWLLRAGSRMSAAARDGWVEVTVPRVFIHEAVRVDLA